MNRSHILFLLVALLVYACGGDSSNTDNIPNDSLVNVDTNDTYVPPVYDPAWCENLDESSFCQNGFSFIKLGDTLAWRKFDLPEVKQKDTVFEEPQMTESGMDSVAWNVTMLDFPDGRVYLESDWASGWFLNRIRIQTPRYTDPNGISVGTHIKELKANYPGLYARPFPEYGVIELFRDNKMYWHVKDEGFYPEGAEEFPLDAIPDNTPITAIVIM